MTSLDWSQYRRRRWTILRRGAEGRFKKRERTGQWMGAALEYSRFMPVMYSLRRNRRRKRLLHKTTGTWTELKEFDVYIVIEIDFDPQVVDPLSISSSFSYSLCISLLFCHSIQLSMVYSVQYALYIVYSHFLTPFLSLSIHRMPFTQCTRVFLPLCLSIRFHRWLSFDALMSMHKFRKRMYI